MSEYKFASPVDPEKYGSFDENTQGVEIYPEETFLFHDHIGSEEYPAEKNRYHLYLAYLCPWAQRVKLIVDYLGLSDYISYTYVHTERDARGWAFREKTGPDTVNGFTLLSEAYVQSESNFKGVPSVPLIWDKKKGRIVNNTYYDTLVDTAVAFKEFSNGKDLYPAGKEKEIDDAVKRIEQGLYYNGFYALLYLKDEKRYHEISAELLKELDYYEEKFADPNSKFLFGDEVTIADIAFWVLIIRLNLSFSKIFKDQSKTPLDYPNLWKYVYRLDAIPEFNAVYKFDYYTEAYFKNNFLKEPQAYKK